jgi:hypothetical protein
MRREIVGVVASVRGLPARGCALRSASSDIRHRLDRVVLVVVVLALAAWLMAPSAALAATAPPNDNYLLSTIVSQAATTGSRETSFQDTQNTSAATTQPDLLIPGTTQGGGGPEPLKCNGVSYGNTIWYDLHPKIPGGVQLIAVGIPTDISLYQWNVQTALITRRVDCQTSKSLDNQFNVPVDLQKGKSYTVQIGGLATTSGFASGPVEFQMNFFPDHDGDGIFDVLDKCPTVPGVERFGGCPPSITPLPRVSLFSVGSGIRITVLRLDQIPGGAQVTVRCQPCGLHQVVQAGPHASSVTMTRFAGQTMAAGDKLEIWVSKRASGTGNYKYGAFGSYVSYTVNAGSLGDRVLRCLMPGSLTPRRVCPPGGRRSVPSHTTRRLTPAGTWADFRTDPLSAQIP